MYPNSKSAKEGQAKAQGKSRLAAAGGVTDSVIEQRKREQIRRLFIAPAKPPTPYTDAELALIEQKRDKRAEDLVLYQAEAAGRCRYFGGRRWAKSAQKAGFSLDRAD